MFWLIFIWVLLVENVSVLIGVIKSAQGTGQCALYGLSGRLLIDPRWPAYRRGAFKTGPTVKSSVQFSILNNWKQGLRSYVKGGDAKTRPPKTFICSKSKVLYRINNIFWQHQCILELIQNTLFMDVEKK